MVTKYLIIGSNSFSGSDFIDFLLEDRRNEVIGISRSPEKNPFYLSYKRHETGRFRFHQIDINSEINRLIDLLNLEKPRFIVNFSALLEPAYSWFNPVQWFYTNTIAIVQLADYLKGQSFLKRYLHISTPEVYGSCLVPAKEDAAMNPSTPYAASKAAADMHLLAMAKNYGFPVTLIRSSNVYGPCQQLYRIIPRSIIHLKQGRPIDLHGGGKAVRSFIHIRDVSRGELAALRHGRPGAIYHLSTDEAMPVRDIVSMVCAIMGKNFEQSIIEVPDRRGQDKAYVIDSGLAHQELGWTAQIKLSAGLKEVKNWLESHWEIVLKEPLEYKHKFSFVPAYRPGQLKPLTEAKTLVKADHRSP